MTATLVIMEIKLAEKGDMAFAYLGDGKQAFIEIRKPANEIEEYAAFIVRAVNSHDELVKALKLYMQLDSWRHSGGRLFAEDWAKCYQAAKAALAKAEER